ncbi:amidohydrolase family protein [Lysinibacter cavernae]|uniref:Imidazolonepropionase-like amidohydrolase n=1 Tax=Lysinibacter cavernae TaxID=1640652 RepID=A0A7X5TTM9_9MICO|nr:amidohydrolase family protein [Lysinibacter cavernae]NIH54801.1 imidazolonepropionase-like amidohydrolase [Lysinibacter cavernae]
MSYQLHAATALLGRSLEPHRDVAITVANGLITHITTGVGPGDLPSHPFVMPGLIDCHVHLALSGGEDVEREALQLDDDRALATALVHARAHAGCGVTTVRDLGSPRHVVLLATLNQAFGDIGMPHVLAAGAISSPAGHGNFLAAHAETLAEYAVELDAIANAGGKYVKLFATGGVVTAGTNPGATQMDSTLIENVTQLAQSKGLHVGTHAHGKQGILNAVRAGVDTIEHFSYLDDEIVTGLAASPSRLVGTYVATERFILSDNRFNATPETLGKIEAHAPHEREALKRAVAAASGDRPIGLAAGTDAGTTFNPHGWGLNEQAIALERSGMSRLDVLKTLTIRGADALGIPAGSLEVGRQADLLILDDDPTMDLAALRALSAVYISGVPVPR